MLNCQKLGGCNNHNKELGQSGSQRGLTQWELRRWCISYDIPRGKIDGQATRTLLNLQNQKQSSLNNQDAESSCSNTKSCPLAELPDMRVFRPGTHGLNGGPSLQVERTLQYQCKVYTYINCKYM